eukprot:SAG11_NODE_33242_length_278_cov_0.871508_1_plen_63_part_01
MRTDSTVCLCYAPSDQSAAPCDTAAQAEARSKARLRELYMRRGGVRGDMVLGAWAGALQDYDR